MARATTVDGGKRKLMRRRIIERPRLIALLDQSTARVRTLVAPAGYGKTTLAEQWVAKEGRRGTWYTARPSSTDVAALALGLARAAAEIVPACDARLREHLRALPAPAENVEVLAELLGEDLASWPDDAWLVLDDYQELTPTAEAEQFVEELVAVAPINVLIASRQRPSWITARRILYGGVLELNQTELAMDGHEAAEVLSERNMTSASGLVALANGWPAVIGLAGVSGAEIDDADSVPDSLYEFFAEEVFSALDSDVQLGLAALALAPVIDRNIAKSMLGEMAEEVCNTALDVGILVERDSRLEMHPLARVFLEDTPRLGETVEAGYIECCLASFLERREWDAAFDLIVRRGQKDQLESLMSAALDDLIETARLSTLLSWCAFAKEAGLEAPIFSLGRAEAALRVGHLAEAQAYAEVVAATSTNLRFRALAIAGRAAHLDSREEEALELFRRAEAASSTDAGRREARWSQAMCMTDLEMPDSLNTIEELATDVGLDNPREAVRAAVHRLTYQMRFGKLELANSDRLSVLVPTINDPLLESAFLSAYAYCLAINARYRDAQKAAASFMEIVRQYRLDFALPFARYAAGLAESGLRNWDAAEQALRRGASEACDASNAHGEQSCVAGLLRTLTQSGQFEAALEIANSYALRPQPPVPVGMRGEFIASHAFVLAAMSRTDEAIAAVESVRGLSSAVEPTVLVAAVDAVAAIRHHDHNVIDRVVALADTAFATGGLDFLVMSYRAVPELLTMLLRSRESERIRGLIRQVGDDDVAQALGISVTANRAATLTAREREVYELLRQGLTNREIATLLYISEGTAKLHVHHVYDKVGVRSRKAIAMQAALERSGQATSAMEDPDVDTGS
jgi:DNA-binding NarL/FixJ family response regulator